MPTTEFIKEMKYGKNKAIIISYHSGNVILRLLEVNLITGYTCNSIE